MEDYKRPSVFSNDMIYDDTYYGRIVDDQIHPIGQDLTGIKRTRPQYYPTYPDLEDYEDPRIFGTNNKKR